MAHAFLPKQITSYDAAALAELQGDVSETIITESLKLAPPIKDKAIIHDNACGAGAVLNTIMMSNPPTSIHIDATDVNSQFVAGCAAISKQNNWPVTATEMSAQELTFPDDRFDLSITNFAFHCIGDTITAARQIHRTLKPGGYAIASVWTDMPHVKALHKAHYHTRGHDGPLPVLLPEDHFEEKDLRTALESGGFERSKIKFSTLKANLRIPDLKRWAQLAWSYLGSLPNGWSKQDEEKWSEVIDIIVQELQNGYGITTNESGETILEMVACVGVATK